MLSAARFLSCSASFGPRFRTSGVSDFGLQVRESGADDDDVNLTQCPYDGAQVEVEVSSGGSLLLTCMACTAVWERHGAWTGRIREPDREKLLIPPPHAPPFF